MPVIAAGRLATPEIAGRVLAEQKADLVGLARVILADGDWVRKAQRGEPVVTCDPTYHRVCEERVSRGLPAICPRWPQERFQLFTLGALRSYSPLRRSYHCLQIFNLPLQPAHPARLLPMHSRTAYPSRTVKACGARSGRKRPGSRGSCLDLASSRSVCRFWNPRHEREAVMHKWIRRIEFGDHALYLRQHQRALRQRPEPGTAPVGTPAGALLGKPVAVYPEGVPPARVQLGCHKKPQLLPGQE